MLIRSSVGNGWFREWLKAKMRSMKESSKLHSHTVFFVYEITLLHEEGSVGLDRELAGQWTVHVPLDPKMSVAKTTIFNPKYLSPTF
jgi:hypothetical protein